MWTISVAYNLPHPSPAFHNRLRFLSPIRLMTRNARVCGGLSWRPFIVAVAMSVFVGVYLVSPGGAGATTNGNASCGDYIQDSRPQPLVKIRPVSWWKERYDSSWQSQLDYGLPLSRSPDSWDYYNLAYDIYDIDGPLAMYHATGDTTYLDQALVYVNNMVARAKPLS